jgi:hypothetical protein
MQTKLVFSVILALGIVSSANATMLVGPVERGSNIEKAYGGCGPYGHRGPWGGCRAGGQWGGYGMGRACPPGFHLGPYGRRCWPN